MTASRKPAGVIEQALQQCRGTVISSFYFSVIINLLMLVPILFMMQLYDRIIPSRSVPTLVALLVLVVFLLVIMGLLIWVRSVMMFRVGARLDRLINQRVFDATVDYARTAPGKETTQPLEDLTNLRQFLGSSTLLSFFDLPLVPVFLAILFLFHEVLGFLTLGGAAILFILAIVKEVRAREPAMLASEQAIRERQALNANLRNVEVMEAMGMRERIFARWQDQHAQTLGWQAAQTEQGASSDALSKTISALLRPIVLAAGGYLAIQQQITPGVIIAASILSGKTVGPISQVIINWKSFLNARASYDRLHGLLDAMPEQPRHISLPRPKGHLQLENVIARPPGTEQHVLRGVSLEIEPGEALGIIGPSAAGKSSLARVMLGIWPVLAGSVRLDGTEIGLYNRDELGRHIGYLPQDTELFSGTIAENIARFREIDDELVVLAAQRANVHDLIGQLPDGYNTLIGPGGVGLSGGQRQRIGLARALYDDPRLVILDEPNASLDEPGERALFSALDNLREMECTVVVISHRTNLLRAVDKVLALKDGQVQAFGSRADVLARVLKVQPSSLPSKPLPRLQVGVS